MTMRSAHRVSRYAGIVVLLAGGVLADDSESIRFAVTRTVDWQLRNRSPSALRVWQQAAMYAGVMATDDTTSDPLYRSAMRQVGLTTGWQPGNRTYHADDHAVCATYLSLALKEGRPDWAAPTLERLEFILANPSTAAVDVQYTSPNPAVVDKVMRWWWCDALFMAPQVWVRAYGLTGDSRYRDFMVQEWQATDALLYSPAHAFYYRDKSFFGKTGADGQPVFWGRGNGWVVGGLVAVLKHLPDDDPARPWFETRFRAMAAALAACQQADGFWRMDLLNPNTDTLGESSATAFFCYGLAYGVNAGLLDSAVYLPPATNAWAALRGAVREDGRLTQVQPGGSAPAAFPADNTELYGVGGFALAGTELYRAALRGERPNSVISVTNAAAGFVVKDILYPLALVPVYAAAPTLPLGVQDDATGRWPASSMIDTDGDGAADSLRFQDRFLPGQVKRYRVFSGLPSDDDGRFLKDLAAWWRMDEAGGDRAVDAVGFRHASASGAVSFAEGKLGGAVALTGGYSSDAALWAPSLPGDLTGCTIAGWIKPSAGYVGQFPRLLACDRFALMLRDSAPYSGVLDLAYYNTSGGSYREWAYSNALASTRITADVWRHIAVTFNLSNPTAPPRFYLDGVYRPAASLPNTGGTLVSSLGNTVIGNRKQRDRSFAGAIDDLRVYARELTGQELAELYRTTVPAAPVPDAGADRLVYGRSACLDGRLGESGLSLSGATPAVRWDALAFPSGGEPVLAAPNALTTEVFFPLPGTYTFRLTADNGVAEASDELTLEVRDAVPDVGNQPPSIMLEDGVRAVTLPAGLRLTAQVSDPDDIPAGSACRILWTKTSGPGAVRFDPRCAAETVAWFSAPGDYTLSVEADDGLAAVSASVDVTVSAGVPPLRWFRLDEVSSGVVADSAKGRHGTSFYVVGTQTLDRAGTYFGRQYGRIEFDFPRVETMTATAWVFHDASGGTTFPRILATSGGEINWEGYFSGNRNCISLNVHQETGAEDEWLTPTDSFRKGEWTHVAMVHDRRGRQDPVLYINGVAQELTRLKAAGAALVRLPPGTRAYIGNSADLDRRWQGTLADFRLYDTLLDSVQINAVMNEAPPPSDAVPPPANLPPEVAVGPVPAVASLHRPLPLTAAAGDDGERMGRLRYRWRKLSGPGTVLFVYADDPETEARFSRSGEYLLELAVSDGEKTTVTNVGVRVRDLSGTAVMLH